MLLQIIGQIFAFFNILNQ